MSRSNTSRTVVCNLACNYASFALNYKSSSHFDYGYFIVGTCSIGASNYMHMDALISMRLRNLLRFGLMSRRFRADVVKIIH